MTESVKIIELYVFSLGVYFWKSKGYHSHPFGQVSKAIQKLRISNKCYINLPFSVQTRPLDKTRNYNRKNYDNNSLIN